MTYVDAIVLGLVQGITEFLPISSSGHLVLMREVLSVQTVHALAIDASKSCPVNSQGVLVARLTQAQIIQFCQDRNNPVKHHTNGACSLRNLAANFLGVPLEPPPSIRPPGM
jgi:undecaprenyl pyrophosphate phosphatase UppP